MESGQAGRGAESDEGTAGATDVVGAPDVVGAQGASVGTPAVKSTPPAGPPSEKHSVLKRWLPLALLVCGVVAAGFVYLKHRQAVLGGLKTGAEQVKEILTGAPRDPYAEAVSKVEEDRGEATGRKAEVEKAAHDRTRRSPL